MESTNKKTNKQIRIPNSKNLIHHRVNYLIAFHVKFVSELALMA